MIEKCLIMLASYNGEKYIGKQIQSIINQDYVDWNLIVQDDGSTDNTLNIIKSYAEKDARIRVVVNAGNHGPYCNFHSLINKCKAISFEYNFFLFSDHDDIWDKNKISEFINYYHLNCCNTVPTMIYADMRIVDSDNHVISQSMNHQLGICYKNVASTFFCHCVFGCNTFFNRKLFDVVPRVDCEMKICSILSHDNFYAKYAAIYGKLIFLDEQLMSYRRYQNNVTANQSYSFNIYRSILRIINLESLAKDHARTYKQSLYTINLMLCDNLSDSKRKLLIDVKKIIITGGVYGMEKSNIMKIRCGNSIKTVSHYFIILTKKYKKYLADSN